jgi:hypothetical protein
MTSRLFLSFWDVCLDNLPEGRFERRRVSPVAARAMIRAARGDKTLMCVSNDDLLAPYRQKQRRRHEALCALLHKTHDIALRLEDFLSTFDEKAGAMQSVTPLQLARLQPGDHLLVVTCNYGFTERNHSADLEDRFILAEDSVRFDLVEALSTQEAATP